MTVPFFPVQNILVIRTDNIGDLICTTPLFSALKQKFPSAKIHVLVNSYNAPVLFHHPHVDQLHIFTKEKHAREKGLLEITLSRWKMWKRIRAIPIDLCISAITHPNRRSMRRARWSGAPRRYGYADPEIKKGFFRYTASVPPNSQPIHEVEAVMCLARCIGYEGPTPDPLLIVTEEEKESLAKKWGLDLSRGLLTVHVSSRKSANRWPLESFAEMILQVKKALPNLPLFVLWAPGRSTEPVFPGDDDRIGRLQERLGGIEGIHFAGGLALRELFALLSLSRLFIGCDGGAMHAAAALGTPVVAIFGKTDPRRWRPWGRDHVVLTPSDGDIRTVSVEQIVSSVLKKLFPG